MEDLVSHLTIYSLYAATLALLFVMLFVHQSSALSIRVGTTVVGLFALALPIWLVSESLGYPDPWPEPGRYRLLGWQVQETDQSIFLFVDQDKSAPPLHLRVPFSRDRALALQKAAEEQGTFSEMAVIIAPGPARSSPEYELVLKKVFSDD